MPRHVTIDLEQSEQTDPTATDLIGRAVRIQQLLQSLSSFLSNTGELERYRE